MLTERQQQIVEESILLIDKKGIQGFTIKNLSKEIGISEPAIYRHFENKFDILSTILISFKQNLIETQKMYSDLNIDPLERLKMFFNNIFKTFSNKPALTSVIFSEEIFQNEKTLCDTVVSIQEVNEKMVIDILKEMQVKHEMSRFVDVETINLMIFGSIRLLVKKWKYSNHSFNLIEKGNNLFNTIINAIK